MKNLTFGISGASGGVLAYKALKFLARQNFRTHIVFTEPAEKIYEYELQRKLRNDLAAWVSEGASFSVYENRDMFAPVASGSFPSDGMIIMPCSMSTAAKIATGTDGNLLCRAASVCIKERIPLVITPRESPLSSIHLQNLLTLANNGVFVMPPVPAFYDKRPDFDEVTDGIAGRVLKTCGVSNNLYREWGYSGV